MKASELDWSSKVHPNLSRDEWPGDVLEHMTETVILAQSDLRKSSGVPMIPSPVEGAHVRHRECSSRHCTRNGKRLSDATDFFVRWEHAPRVLLYATHQGSIGGLGIYDRMMLRGTPGDFCMFHIDTRNDRVCWVGHGREPVEYVYSHEDPARYHALISRMFEAHGH